MKKQLYFNFYVSTYYPLNSIINNIHFACLEYYKDVFDEVFINISLDDTEDYELIREVKNKFLDIFGHVKRIVFKVMRNNPYMGEVDFFYEEILEKLNDLDLVFFAHNKGITNIYREDMDKDDLFHWIIALYYGSLYDIHEMQGELLHNSSLMYGSCTTHTEINDYFVYSGTFYWLNCKRIANFLKLNNIDIPLKSDRCNAEDFPHYIRQMTKRSGSFIIPCSFSHSSIEFGEGSFDWYSYAKDYCEIIGYLTDEFYNLYNYAIKKEYFI